MGKASKWFRGLLGLKKAESSSSNSNSQLSPRKKWNMSSFSQYKKKPKSKSKSNNKVDDEEDNKDRRCLTINKPAAAAAGAVGVVTSTHDRAAVLIQSHFRAYLSRRALRALKALVKLQALVRGHLMRKRTADALRQLQALVRAQTRARVGRVLLSESPNSGIKSSSFNYSGPATPDKFENVIRARSMKHEQSMMLKRNGSKSYGRVSYEPEKSHLNRVWMDSRTGERLWEHQGSFTRIMPTDNERGDKILGVDTGKPHTTPKRRNLFHSSHLFTDLDQNYPTFSTSKDSTARQTVVSLSSGEVQSFSPLKVTQDVVESAFCTADNSPQFYSASSMGCSSKREACTPTKSDCSRSILSGYSDHPNYMSYTESSKAKVRSLSAPKQRPQYERSSSTKRYSVHGCGDPRSAQRVHELHVNFASKAYPGSGRLDRLGMPVRGDVSGFSGGHWLRY